MNRREMLKTAAAIVASPALVPAAPAPVQDVVQHPMWFYPREVLGHDVLYAQRGPESVGFALATAMTYREAYQAHVHRTNIHLLDGVSIYNACRSNYNKRPYVSHPIRYGALGEWGIKEVVYPGARIDTPTGPGRLLASVTIVESVEDADKCIRRREPVVIFSNQGFRPNKDPNGIWEPKGHWPHGLTLVHIDNDEGTGYLANTWQHWPFLWSNDGRTKTIDEAPANVFRTRLETIEKMLRQRESWAINRVKVA